MADARPLADLVWMRETSGGVFDTPERKAELEKTLRELTARIKDESVRFHYAQEMRDRVQAFFGSQRAGAAATGQMGQERKGAGRPVRAPRSGRRALRGFRKSGALGDGQAGGGVMPLRETAIVVALVNHPELIDENFEHAELLELSHPDLRHLHVALIDAMAHGAANDRDAVIATIERAGHLERWERAVALIRKARLWPVLEDAALDDAREAFAQALHLHRSARNAT